MMENIPFLFLYFMAYRFFHNKVLFNANASEYKYIQKITQKKMCISFQIAWAFRRMEQQKFPEFFFHKFNQIN